MFDMSFGPGMETRVTPALLNLVNLLSLPSISLHELVQQELVENPALEEIEHSEGPDEGDIDPHIVEQLLRDLREDEANWEQNSYQGDEETDAFLFVAAPRSLSEGLLADLSISLPESEHDIALTLVGNLDDQGFWVILQKILQQHSTYHWIVLRMCSRSYVKLGHPALPHVIYENAS